MDMIMAPVFTLFLLHIIHFSSACPCTTPYECSGQSLSGTCDVEAYKGAFGENTTFSGQEINCVGSFSCQYMSSITAQTVANCRARDSCSYTNVTIESRAELQCTGANSCSFSNIDLQDGAFLICTGYLSCRSARIYTYGRSTTIIDARGSLSLYQATIETVGDKNLVVEFDFDASLAGFGAKLICNALHTCNIHCDSYDACYMLYIECFGTCNVDATNVIAPITNIAELNVSLTSSIPKLFDSQSELPFDDELCANDIWNFDESEEQRSSASISLDAASEGPLCCRGYRSCAYVTSLQLHSNTNNDLVCGGYQSCRASVINNNNGNIYCEANDACLRSTITDAQEVYCGGRSSCQYSTIMNANYVICNGYSSCIGSVIRSKGNGDALNVFFLGRGAGYNTTVYCDATDICSVYCSGQNVCRHTTLNCVNNCNIECNEVSSWCPQVTNRPTMNPTQSIKDPSTSPTQETFYPSWNPTETTSDPSSQPVKITPYPSWNPTPDPSVNPIATDTTLHPSAGETEEPLHSSSSSIATTSSSKSTLNMTMTNVTIMCEGSDCNLDDEDIVEVITVIIIAHLDEDARIVGTEVKNNRVVVYVANVDEIKLDKDTISTEIKKELRYSYEKEVDVTFSETEDEDDDEDENEDEDNQNLGFIEFIPYNIAIAGALIVACVLILIWSACVCCRFFKKRKQAKKDRDMIAEKGTDTKTGDAQPGTQDTQLAVPPPRKKKVCGEENENDDGKDDASLYDSGDVKNETKTQGDVRKEDVDNGEDDGTDSEKDDDSLYGSGDIEAGETLGATKGN